MESVHHHHHAEDANIEERLRAQLIDKMLLLTAIVGGISFALAELRALHIGWSIRDLLQGTVVGGIVLLTWARQRFSARVKAVLLISAFVAGGISGFSTLGMLGGTVFLFPMAAVVVALFFSLRTTMIFGVASLCFCSLVAAGFSSGAIHLPLGVGFFMTSIRHWVVYIMCIAIFFVLACVTILDYRRAMAQLIAEVRSQRDELSASNTSLRKALDAVKVLSGLLPICSSCKKIRDDQGYWSQIESYISARSDAEFSHSICPDCMRRLYPEEYALVIEQAQVNWEK